MSRDATLFVDDMIEACRRVMQYTESLDRTQLASGTVAHGYLGIDDDIVWSIVVEEVPTLLPRLVARGARISARSLPQTRTL